jgi:glycosyltransferase involved in cell wall biosynthesis
MTAKKIRVCHLSSVHYAQEGRILYKECRSLAKEYDVTLIAPHDKAEIIEGVKINPLKRAVSRLSRFLFIDQQLLIKAARVNADIYHFHDPELIPAGLFLHLLGKKVIYDIHELVDDDLTEKKWLPLKGLFRASYRQLERQARKAFAFVFANEATADHYRPLKEDEITVLNYVPFDLLRSYRKQEFQASSKLLWVGSLGAKRGLLQLIEALHLLKQKGIILELHCVGRRTDALDETLKASEYYREVQDQIIFEGFKPLTEAYTNAQEYLAGIALLDYTMNHSIHAPTKQYEYMAVGLPFLISDFPKHETFVEEYRCGLAVDVQSPEAIANALEWMYLNQEKAYELGQNGLRVIESGKFNWQSEEKKLLDLYKRLA